MGSGLVVSPSAPELVRRTGASITMADAYVVELPCVTTESSSLMLRERRSQSTRGEGPRRRIQQMELSRQSRPDDAAEMCIASSRCRLDTRRLGKNFPYRKLREPPLRRVDGIPIADRSPDSRTERRTTHEESVRSNPAPGAGWRDRDRLRDSCCDAGQFTRRLAGNFQSWGDHRPRDTRAGALITLPT